VLVINNEGEFMSNMSQKQSVFVAVCAVLGENDINREVKLTKEQRAEVIGMVTDSIVSGETEFSAEAKAKYPTKDDVKGYVNGMVSNWLRKDLRLNGGTKYETKNPGSRAGSGDAVLKNLKALKSTLSDKDHIAAVDEEITKRQAELAEAKAKSVTINVDKIPEALRHLIKAS
jgi:hypothetical protein